MDVRYEGSTGTEPDLVLTESVQRLSNTTNFMGRLSTLLLWHEIDPVDNAERSRNDKVFTLYQHNRNPFVDRPEWAREIFWPKLQILRSTGSEINVSAPADFTNAIIEMSPQLPPIWQPLSEAQGPAPQGFYRLKVW
jgi:hypothetical protein